MPTIEEIKIYLGIDGSYNDSLIDDFLKTAKEIVEKVLRYEIENLEPMPVVIKEAVKYAVGYLYSNRETADFLMLEKTIAIILSHLRKEGL